MQITPDTDGPSADSTRTGPAARHASLRPFSIKIAVVLLTAAGLFAAVAPIVVGYFRASSRFQVLDGAGLYVLGIGVSAGLLMVVVAIGLWRAWAWAHALATILMISTAWVGISGVVSDPGGGSWRLVAYSAFVLPALFHVDSRNWCYGTEPGERVRMPGAVAVPVVMLWLGVASTLVGMPFLLWIDEGLQIPQWLALMGTASAALAAVLGIALTRHSMWARWATVVFVIVSAAGGAAVNTVLGYNVQAWIATIPAAGWAAAVVVLLLTAPARDWFELPREARRGLTRSAPALAKTLKRMGIASAAVAAVLAAMWAQSVFVGSEDPDPIADSRAPIDSSTCEEFEFSRWEQIVGEFSTGAGSNSAEEFEEDDTGRVRCGGMSTGSGNVRTGEVTVEVVVEPTDAAALERSELIHEEYTERERWTVASSDYNVSTTGFRAVDEGGGGLVLWFVADNLLISIDGYVSQDAGMDAEAEAALEDLLDQAYALFEGYTDLGDSL